MADFWDRQWRRTKNAYSDLEDWTGDVWNDVSGVTAADKAATAQRDALKSGEMSQERMFNQALDVQRPWLEAGGRGLSQLESGIGSGAFDSNPGAYQSPQFSEMKFDFEADPGYQFRMSEGSKAIEASQAAKGGLFSGNTGIELQKYGQGLASQEYGAAFDRFDRNRNFQRGAYESDRGALADEFNRDRVSKMDRYNRLASLAGVGQVTAQDFASAQTQQGGNLANMAQQRGNIGAQRAQAGYQGGTNLVNTGIKAISTYYGLT